MARRSGQEIADPYAVARDTCYRLLATRQRSRQELHDALARKGIDQDTITGVLGKFEHAGLVDDATFATEWTRARARQTGLSRGAIRAELQRKGVDADLVADAVDEIDEDAERRRAAELVRKKLRGVDPVGTPEAVAKLQRRLVGLLARKGYPAELVHGVVREQLRAAGVTDPESAGSFD